MNLSLGSSGSSDGTDSLSKAVDNAFDSGILPVVVAGNSGPAAYTIGSPAAAAKALTVCSLADPGERGFFVSPFSSRGPTADGRTKPDLWAAGHRVTAPKANSGTGYVRYSGTSMAAPFVAGVAALMLDANYALGAADLKSKLLSTAQDWRSTGPTSTPATGACRRTRRSRARAATRAPGPPFRVTGGRARASAERA